MALDLSREEIMKRTSLNHVYRIVWSQVLDAWVAVAEIAHGRGKSKTSRKSRASIGRLIAAIVSLSATLAQAAPAGGQIAAGSGSISQSGSTTTVQQASSKLSVNWASFNLAPQEAVNFVQPSAAAIAVNRIFDTNGSQILGQLNANGQVYLINPNGIVFGQGAQVNVGGLVASTLDLNDASLNGDARRFSGNGGGSIVNLGTINAARGGYVALLGNQVSNQGVITAQLGTVALAAGSAATLTFSGNSLVAMQVDQSVLNSLAENGGLIRADGGLVAMTAGARNALLASVVNNTGIIEARTVEDHNGTIVLLGGMQAGQAKVGGTLDASAPNGGNGGFIETSAAQVKVANDARVTTAAPLGNHGSWLIDPQDFSVAASGGDISGATLSTTLGSTPVTIQSSGGGSTGSGNIDVDDALSWSADTTLTLTASKHVNVNANITATGNAAGLAINANTANGSETASGDGAFNLKSGASITLSGSNPNLSIGGTAYTVINSLGVAGDTSATTLQGMNGDLAGHYALGSDIDATATSIWRFTPIGKFATPFGGVFDGLGHTISNLIIDQVQGVDLGLFAVTVTGSVIANVGLIGGSVSGSRLVGGLIGRNDGTIRNSYATGNVSARNDLVGGLVGGNSGTILNSYATGNVTGYVFVGGLVGHNSGTIRNSYATGSVSGNNVVGGLVGQNQSTIKDSYFAGSVSGTTHVGGLVGSNENSGNFGSITNAHYNVERVTVNGSQALTLGGLYDLQYQDWLNHGMSLDIANYASSLAWDGVSGHYRIANAQGLKDLLGFADNGTYKFELAADIDLSGTPGLWIPYFSGAEFDGAGHTLSNLTVDLPFVPYVGMFGMLAHTSTIRNLGVLAGSVLGLYHVGGLVGNNVGGMITNSYATGGLSGGEVVGGLVGANSGTISNSYATGDVRGTGDYYVGGLVGYSQAGTITNSYATGSLNGGARVGGLVGANIGTTITNSHATGDVRGTGDAVGGLVGYSEQGILYVRDGAISDSYATGSVSGARMVGGLVGFAMGGIISNSYASGNVSGTIAYVGGLVGYNGRTISNSYATGSVLGLESVGGLVGINSGSVSTSYATGNVTETGGQQAQSAGGLVGDNFGTISNSYAAGSVSSMNSVGGLVGYNSGTISNSYATGSVSGLSLVGGLVGYNTGTISNSYAVGSVSGTNYVGGLVGYTPYTVTSSFWDIETSGQTNSTGGTGMSTAQMQQQGNFTSATSANGHVNPAWDFGDTWVMYDTHTYPLLRAFMSPLTVSANFSKTYDGLPYAVASGVSYSTPPNLANVLGTVSYDGTAQGARNVGSYTITPGGLYSNQQGYIISYADSALTIAPATLTYVATPASFAAGQTPSALSGTVEGFVAGDGLASSTSGTLAWLTAASASSPAGLYAINGSGLTATNYIFAQAAGNATALTLNPVTPLDPTAKPPSSNAANSATPTTTTSNVTTNTATTNATNVPPPTQAASNLLATTQLLTNVLASLQSIEPEPPDPSSTLTVNEVSGAPPAGETASPPAGDRIDVLSNIGGIGPTLYIVNGGTRLPANQLTGN
ncbi:MAG: filamentous hemagglutinin N-terminal domain-containing protein [Candidatus Accumulibacter sp.]|uniref:GLUG motif-containing protein n=1 Tax=Accumulibacter sp. TaxID=2053492 RepID=UPI0025D490B9|nr:GLUG motif-containing protein [Accumulibacter sp.]MCP5248092.1 filamentous hemagglutinin N-terminal domain-containing protein [Accumulibacter sp.]